MFPYCCLLIICIMLFPCSVFKVHLSLFAQGSSQLPERFIQRIIYLKRNFTSAQRTLHFFTLHYYLLPSKKWWAKVDSNHRPHDYQSCALAS